MGTRNTTTTTGANERPVTLLAREDAKLVARYRRAYPDHAADAARFGRSVADFNAGFTEGDANGRRKLARRVLRVFRDVSARRSGPWTARQRRDWDAVCSELEKHAARPGATRRRGRSNKV